MEEADRGEQVLQLQVAGTSSTGLSFEEESTGSKES
jgi:hypothetical protein